MLMPHWAGMSSHAMDPSTLSHHQVHVEMVLGSDGRLGVASFKKNCGRPSTQSRATARVRMPANRDEGLDMMGENGGRDVHDVGMR